MNSSRVRPYSRSHPICYGSVKSCLMTMYFIKFVSLIGVGPRWGQNPKYAKILKAPCGNWKQLGFCFQRGLILLNMCLLAIV